MKKLKLKKIKNKKINEKKFFTKEEIKKYTNEMGEMEVLDWPKRSFRFFHV